jgi:hypothetical protein
MRKIVGEILLLSGLLLAMGLGSAMSARAQISTISYRNQIINDEGYGNNDEEYYNSEDDVTNDGQ